MSKKKMTGDGIVYSTNPDYKNMSSEEDTAPPSSSSQDLRVWKEFHGGKPVTIVRNYSGPAKELESLGKELKIKCGTGGSVKNGEILIQGDHREKVVKMLLEKGFRVKKAGS